jgi:hypothetical protein
MMQDVGASNLAVLAVTDAQVEEQRTPLQLAMDDLAKRLSFFSFGVIGVIFLIGVLQHRGWLEMFTIGGKLFQPSQCLDAEDKSLSRSPQFLKVCQSSRPSPLPWEFCGCRNEKLSSRNSPLSKH